MPARPSSRPLVLFVASYIVLLSAASLYPFGGGPGLASWSLDFLFAPLPRYITRNDLTTNLMVYLPLGYALGRILALRHHREWAAPLALATGALLSVGLESLQQLIPGRIASNLDVFVNALGSGVGSLLALHHGRWLRAWQAAYRWRGDWFRPHGPTTLGLWLLVLWCFTHFTLLPMPGTGWLALHLRPADMPLNGLGQVNLGWLAAVFMEMLTLGAFVATLLKPGRYVSAIFFLFVAAFALKLLAAAVLLRLKVIGGILSLETLLAFLLAFWVLLLPLVSRHRRALALACLALIGIGRLWLVPGALWPTGSLLNLVGLASHVAAVWPMLALGQQLHAWWLSQPSRGR